MRTGALAAASGATAKTIRFYEQAGLLPAPPRTPGGYRDYPPQAQARLAFIRAAQAAGLSLPEIRAVLAIRDHGQPPCTHVTALLRRYLTETEQRLAELTATRAMLRVLLTTGDATDPATCTGSMCRILDPPGGVVHQTLAVDHPLGGVSHVRDTTGRDALTLLPPGLSTGPASITSRAFFDQADRHA